jgi:hypothetical protein
MKPSSVAGLMSSVSSPSMPYSSELLICGLFTEKSELTIAIKFVVCV